MRRTLVSSKGFHAPRPSGGGPPAEATRPPTASPCSTLSTGAQSQTSSSTAAAAAAATSTRGTNATVTHAELTKTTEKRGTTPAKQSRTSVSTTATPRKSKKDDGRPSTSGNHNHSRSTTSSGSSTSAVSRPGTVSAMLAGSRGGLSGHFSANHARRGGRREENTYASTLYAQPTPTAADGESGASAVPSQSSNMEYRDENNDPVLSAIRGQEKGAESRKRSRSPSIVASHDEQHTHHAHPPSHARVTMDSSASSTPSNGCGSLAEALSDEPLVPASRASRRPSWHVPRTVFYPPPAELAGVAALSEADSRRLVSREGTQAEENPHLESALPPPSSSSPAVTSHSEISLTTARRYSNEEDVPLTDLFAAHAPCNMPTPPSPDDVPLAVLYTTPDKARSRSSTLQAEATADPSTGVEADTTASSSSSQPATWFLSALEHQQREQQQQQYLRQISTNSPLTPCGESPLPSHPTPSNRSPATPPAMSLSAAVPASGGAAPPPQPQPLVACRSPLHFSQSSSLDEQPLLETSPSSTPPHAPRDNTALSHSRAANASPAAAAQDLRADRPVGAGPFPLPPPLESPPSAFVRLALPHVDDDASESAEALQREMAEDLRLSTDVGFTPSGSGSGAPPVLSQTSLLMDEDEEEEERGISDPSQGHDTRGKGEKNSRGSKRLSFRDGEAEAGAEEEQQQRHFSPSQLCSALDNWVEPAVTPQPAPCTVAASPVATITSAADTCAEGTMESSAPTLSDTYPPQSTASWPLQEPPLPHIPAPLHKPSSPSSSIPFAVVSSVAAAAAASSGSGSGSRHRTVFSFSSRKPLADTEQESSSLSAPAAPAESPSVQSASRGAVSVPRDMMNEEGERSILIPPAFATSPATSGITASAAAAQISEEASQVPSLLGGSVEGLALTSFIAGTADTQPRGDSSAAEKPHHANTVALLSAELPSLAATENEEEGRSNGPEALASDATAGGDAMPVQSASAGDVVNAEERAVSVGSPSTPVTMNAAHAEAMHCGEQSCFSPPVGSVSPARVAPSVQTSPPARPGRTCFTLRSVAPSVVISAPQKNDDLHKKGENYAMPSAIVNEEESNSVSQVVAPAPAALQLEELQHTAAAAVSTADRQGVGLADAPASTIPTAAVAATNAAAMPPGPVLADFSAVSAAIEQSMAAHARADEFDAEAPPAQREMSPPDDVSQAAPMVSVSTSAMEPHTPAVHPVILNEEACNNRAPNAFSSPAPPPPSAFLGVSSPAAEEHRDQPRSLSTSDAIVQQQPPLPAPEDTFYDLPLAVGTFYAKQRGVHKLYDWQHELLSEPDVRRGRNFIYSLPTSGGKTLVAELSLLRCVLNRRQSCFFVLPFVSLAEEKTLALQPLTNAFDFNVDGHYGSSGRFPLCEAPAIYVCTIEKANSLLNYILEEGRTAELGAVVVDELHMVGESRRGATLELFLSKLLMIDEERQRQREAAAAAAAMLSSQQHEKGSSQRTHANAQTGGASEGPGNGSSLGDEEYYPEDFEEYDAMTVGGGGGAAAAPADLAASFHDPGLLQIIGMSATVPNLQTIAEWLHAACFERDFRPVPLRAYSVVGGLVLRDGQRNERNLSGGNVNQHLLELATEVPEASVLVFCASRQQCVDTARGIVHYLRAQAIAGQQLPAAPSSASTAALSAGAATSGDGASFAVFGVAFSDVAGRAAVSAVPSQASPAMKSLLADLAALSHYEASQLSEIVPYGVAFHHGGLLAEERELIEAAFRRKHIRILCSTSTLAAGVNLPARRVIIKTPYVGRDFLTKSRYLQMCGRAGRAGLDPYGESFLLLTRRDQSRGHALMHAAVEPCCSQLLEDDQTLTRSLLECIGVGLVTDSASAQRWSASLLGRHAVGPIDAGWRKHVAPPPSLSVTPSLEASSPSAAAAAGERGTPVSPALLPAAPNSGGGGAADEESADNSRSAPSPPPPPPPPPPPSTAAVAAAVPQPLTQVPTPALLSMVRAALEMLARCGLVAVSLDAEAMRHNEEGPAENNAGAVEESLQVRVTPFGSSSVRSCFSVEEALLLREELEELRHTGLILSDDLHLCYFLTPLREVGECDWELLRLMMSRMSDSRQRIASLLGVDAYFIDQQAMGLGGPMQATEEGRRRLFTAKRFYVALMLADVLAEVPMPTVEQRYNVNRGQLQNLMRSASMFSSSITSFCHAMEWYSLEAVLSSFVKRLGFGVKPDLLPLMEMRGMQPPRARALWNAGFKKLSLIAAADADDMVAKVKSMNPPESKSAKFFTKRSALMVIREANLTLQSQIKEKKGELQELTVRGAPGKP